MEVVKQVVLDLLPTTGAPQLSTTTDAPVIETKPDATPAAVEVVPETAKDEESVPSDKPDDPAAPPAKKSQGVQKRIDELTRQREDERRAREAAEAREARILAVVERLQGVKPQQDPNVEDTEPVKPLKGAFENPDEYDTAIENYIVDKAAFVARKESKAQREEERKRTAEEARNAQARAVQEAYQGRVSKAKEKYADFSEVAESPDVVVSIPMSLAILNSEQGPDIQYFLGKNPSEAKRISEMTITDHMGQVVPDVARQLVELGRIASKIEAPVIPKPVSAAPAPIKPIGKSETTVKSPEEESMDEYAARRKKELNPVRPGVRH